MKKGTLTAVNCLMFPPKNLNILITRIIPRVISGLLSVFLVLRQYTRAKVPWGDRLVLAEMRSWHTSYIFPSKYATHCCKPYTRFLGKRSDGFQSTCEEWNWGRITQNNDHCFNVLQSLPHQGLGWLPQLPSPFLSRGLLPHTLHYARSITQTLVLIDIRRVARSQKDQRAACHEQLCHVITHSYCDTHMRRHIWLLT